MFLIGKFLGLLKVFDIDPFGAEPEWVYGVIALGVGVLYNEILTFGLGTSSVFVAALIVGVWG